MEIDLALLAGGLGAEHAVKPGVLMRMYARSRIFSRRPDPG
jgi:hypothetical protein